MIAFKRSKMSRAASISSVYSSSSSNQRAAGRPDKVSDLDYRWRLSTRENFVICLLLRRTKLAYGNLSVRPIAYTRRYIGFMSVS